MSLEYEIEHLVCWRCWTFGVAWDRFAARCGEPPGFEIVLHIGPLSVHLTIWDRAEG